MDLGREPGTSLRGKGSPWESEQFATRPRKTAHSCGLGFKTKRNARKRSCSRLGFRCPPLPSSRRDWLPHHHGFSSPSLSGTLPSAKLRPPPASSPLLTARHAARGRSLATLPPRTSPARGCMPAGWSAGPRSLRGFCILFFGLFLNKKP